MGVKIKEVEDIFEKMMLEKVSKLVLSSDMEENICKEINSPFNFTLGLDHIIASSYTRSFSSGLGTHLQAAATKIAKVHGWEIINDDITDEQNEKIKINGFYSNETRIVIDNAMDAISKCNKNNIFTVNELSFWQEKIKESAIKECDAQISRNADIIIGKYENKDLFQISLIETKLGGDLDKSKATAQRRELFELYAVLCSKYREEILLNKVQINTYFATLYNKTSLFDGSNKWNSGAVTKNFPKEELLIGKDFWEHVCNCEGAYQDIIKCYAKHSVITKNSIKELKEKIKPLISKKINSSSGSIKELYEDVLKKEF